MIEINQSFKEANTTIGMGPATVLITPPIGSGYFIARVPLFADQAIQIFPKFSTVGCGFAQEEDWNTNLPITLPAEEIYRHIEHNKKYAEITEDQAIAAIKELQQWWTSQRNSE